MKRNGESLPRNPFYTFDESTYPLVALAKHTGRFREFQHLWKDYHGSLASDSDVILAQSPDYGAPFNWLPESRLIRVIASTLATSHPSAAFQSLSDGLKAFEEGFASQSNKDQAKIHLITACDTLWEEGGNRDDVTKGQLKDSAKALWAESLCRRKNQPSTNESIAREQGRLPHVDWPLIFKELGLDDIKGNRPGRKRKVRNR
jgi:hypothetical protein